MRHHLKFLGVKVRDRISGFTGIGTTVAFDLYGCIQTIVTPPVDEKGAPSESRWFDNNRLEIIDEAQVMKVPNFAVLIEDRDNTGPAAKPAMRELPAPR